MPENQKSSAKKIVSSMPIQCSEQPEKFIELITFEDDTGVITCDLFHTNRCSHSCVYSYVCKIAPKGLV